MEKEIKFRAWDGKNKTMFFWTMPNFDSKHASHYDNIMQYIGIKDKNGIEIYEGDYLVDRYPVDDEDLSKGYHESFLPVVWSPNRLQWCVDASFAKDGSYLVSLIGYFGEHLEVKGNIYENLQP